MKQSAGSVPELDSRMRGSIGPRGTFMGFLLGALQKRRREALLMVALLVVIIALIDWDNTSIYVGFLYVFPMLLAGPISRPWQLGLTALGCTALAEVLDPFPFTAATSFPQGVSLFVSLFGMGMFSRQMYVNHEQEMENLARIRKETDARREAEEQLDFLIQTSPVAILVTNGEGEILIANSASDHLFRVGPGELVGRNISRYIASLAHVLSAEHSDKNFRTEMECRGTRDNGDLFSANVFFSTYRTSLGSRLAALVVDTSEDLRDRTEYGLEELMAGSRTLLGAVSHEVRNVCGAISVIHENLARSGDFRKNRDFDALGSLIEALNKIASLELRRNTGGIQANEVSLTEILDEARIVLNPYCAEADIAVNWDLPKLLPSVWADRHSLLHVLLNLVKNSRRALEDAPVKRIDLSVSVDHGKVFIRVCDTGPGIASPEDLFHPLQKDSAATGLGLFLSRAFMRSFGGDLRHFPDSPGCCFVIEMAMVSDT